MKKKEIFIFLPLIIISSLIIYFINPKQSETSYEFKKDNIFQKIPQVDKNEFSGIFKGIENIKLDNKINIIPDMFSNNSSIDKNQESIEKESEQKQNEQNSEENIEQNEQSMDDILAEIEKLSLELELELENIKGAPSCSTSQDINQESAYCKSACAQREKQLKEIKNNILFFDPCAACGPCICLCHCCGPICCI